jgi:hypothetical protein
LCNLLHSSVTSPLLGPNILLNTLSVRFSLNVSDQVSHPYKTTLETYTHCICFLLTFDVYFLDCIYSHICPPTHFRPPNHFSTHFHTKRQNRPAALQQTGSITTDRQHYNRPAPLQQTDSITTDRQHYNRPTALQQTDSITTDRQHYNRPAALQQTDSITTDPHDGHHLNDNH